MIKPEELRIGSTVWLKSKGKPYTITSGHDIDEGIDSDDFEPISLTEEWLLKLRLSIDKLDNPIMYADLKIINPVTNDFIFDLKNIGEGWFYKNAYFKIKSVHQLENLYFALTGEELKIK